MLTTFVTLYLFMLGDHNLCPKGFERQADICVARNVKFGDSCPPFTVFSEELKKCIHYHYHYHDMCLDGYRKENGICVIERSGTKCPPYTLYSDALGKCIHVHAHPAESRDRGNNKNKDKNQNEQNLDRKHEDHTEHFHNDDGHVHIEHTAQHAEHKLLQDVHDHTYENRSSLHPAHPHGNHPNSTHHDRDMLEDQEFTKYW